LLKIQFDLTFVHHNKLEVIDLTMFCCKVGIQYTSACSPLEASGFCFWALLNISMERSGYLIDFEGRWTVDALL